MALENRNQGQEFGDYLRSLRLAAGLSQVDLAGKAALDPTYVGRIERGKYNPPRIRTAMRLAVALSLDEETRKLLIDKTGRRGTKIEMINESVGGSTEITHVSDPEEIILSHLARDMLLARRMGRKDLVDILYEAAGRIVRISVETNPPTN